MGVCFGNYMMRMRHGHVIMRINIDEEGVFEKGHKEEGLVRVCFGNAMMRMRHGNVIMRITIEEEGIFDEVIMRRGW